MVWDKGSRAEGTKGLSPLLQHGRLSDIRFDSPPPASPSRSDEEAASGSTWLSRCCSPLSPSWPFAIRAQPLQPNALQDVIQPRSLHKARPKVRGFSNVRPSYHQVGGSRKKSAAQNRQVEAAGRVLKGRALFFGTAAGRLQEPSSPTGADSAKPLSVADPFQAPERDAADRRCRGGFSSGGARLGVALSLTLQVPIRSVLAGHLPPSSLGSCTSSLYGVLQLCIVCMCVWRKLGCFRRPSRLVCGSICWVALVVCLAETAVLGSSACRCIGASRPVCQVCLVSVHEKWGSPSRFGLPVCRSMTLSNVGAPGWLDSAPSPRSFSLRYHSPPPMLLPFGCAATQHALAKIVTPR